MILSRRAGPALSHRADTTVSLLVICDTPGQLLIQVGLLRQNYAIPIDRLLTRKSESARNYADQTLFGGNAAGNRSVKLPHSFYRRGSMRFHENSRFAPLPPPARLSFLYSTVFESQLKAPRHLFYCLKYATRCLTILFLINTFRATEICTDFLNEILCYVVSLCFW